MNVVTVDSRRINRDHIELSRPGSDFADIASTMLLPEGFPDGPFQLGFRPESVSLVAQQEALTAVFRVDAVEQLGSRWHAFAVWGNDRVTIVSDVQAIPKRGQLLTVYIPWRTLHAFAADTGKRLTVKTEPTLPDSAQDHATEASLPAPTLTSFAPRQAQVVKLQ